jgi:hypothetical protein
MALDNGDGLQFLDEPTYAVQYAANGVACRRKEPAYQGGIMGQQNEPVGWRHCVCGLTPDIIAKPFQVCFARHVIRIVAEPADACDPQTLGDLTDQPGHVASVREEVCWVGVIVIPPDGVHGDAATVEPATECALGFGLVDRRGLLVDVAGEEPHLRTRVIALRRRFSMRVGETENL